MQPYNDDFYIQEQEGARLSAMAVVPLVLDLVRPRNVIDVGCGLGTWLSVFKRYGVDDIWGVDGGHVNTTLLEIPRDRFRAFDLKQPFRMSREFDLVMSLEVAADLPSECAVTFVESLTELGPVVVFSSAIPFQEGQCHVNEQWPDYWAEIFERRDYVVIDCVRRKIWQHEDVQWWYAQNMLMFVGRRHLESQPRLKAEYQSLGTSELSVVHPKKYLGLVERCLTLERLDAAARDILSLIPPSSDFVLVDNNQWDNKAYLNRRPIPFLERDGQYWGKPPDGGTAIRELERLRESGASFIVFGWPAFWWLDYYSELNHHLRSTYQCILENERVLIFQLST